MSEVQTEATETTQATTEPVVETTETTAAPDTSWVPKRIGEVTAARRKAEEERDAERAENARLKAELDAMKATKPAGETTTQTPAESVETLAKAYAERMRAAERKQETEQQRLASVNAKITAINEEGTKEFGDEFDKSAKVLNEAGVVSPEFLGVLADVPNAHKIVTMLAKTENIGEALRIATLSPIQMGIELTKMSAKAAKESAKQISKAPAPVTTVDGRATGGDGPEPDASDTKAWIAYRNKTARRK